MDDESSSRMRAAILAAAASGSGKQRSLASTLRLAGHAVELPASRPNTPDDPEQPDDSAPREWAAGFEQRPLSGEPSESSLRIALDTFERAAKSTRPAAANHPVPPAGGGRFKLMPDHPHDRPVKVIQRPLPLLPPGARQADYIQLQVDRASRAELPAPASQAALPAAPLDVTPPDDAAISPAMDDSLGDESTLAGDAPSFSSIAVTSELASVDRSPAPGRPPRPPNPGAGSFFIPAASADGGAGNDGGGEMLSTDDGGADDQAPAPQVSVVVQPTVSRTDEMATAAAAKALALAEATAAAAVADLRNEIYASRAARNALFPR